MVGILAAGLRQNLVEDSMYWNRATVQTNTERGSVVRNVPFVYITFIVTLLESRQCRLHHRLQYREALKRMSLLRDNDFTAKAVRDMIAEVEGRKPRKKKPTPQTTIVDNKHCVQFRSGTQCDDQLGNSSCAETFRHHHHPQSSPITRLWPRFVVGILQKERMRVRREKALLMDEDL